MVSEVSWVTKGPSELIYNTAVAVQTVDLFSALRNLIVDSVSACTSMYNQGTFFTIGIQPVRRILIRLNSFGLTSE